MPNKPVSELLLQLLLRGYHLEYDSLHARKLHNIGRHLSASRRGGSNTNGQQLDGRNSHSLPCPGNNDHAQQWQRGNQSHSVRIRVDCDCSVRQAVVRWCWIHLTCWQRDACRYCVVSWRVACRIPDDILVIVVVAVVLELVYSASL